MEAVTGPLGSLDWEDIDAVAGATRKALATPGCTSFCLATSTARTTTAGHTPARSCAASTCTTCSATPSWTRRSTRAACGR